MARRKTKAAKPIKSLKAAKKVEKKEPKAVVQNKEVLLPAIEIAEILQIPSFEFYILKNAFKFDDEALFTVPQLKEMYQKTIKGR